MNEKIITVLLVVLIVIAGIQTVQLLQMSGAFESTGSTTGYFATTTAGQDPGYSAPAPQMVGGC